MSTQFTDPYVSMTKFDREINEYRELSREYERRGWFLVEAQFPFIFVVMAACNVKPSPLVLGVLLDYSNYDTVPPSVRLVDPFSREPYTGSQLPTPLMRGLPIQQMQIPGLPPNAGFQVRQAQPLMQFHHPDDIPFLCIAGVKEYHEHPGHSGDSWELHRSSGAGRLVRILEVIHRYGVAPIQDLNVTFRTEVSLQFGEPPT